MKINVLCDLFVFQNFIHSGAGNTELSGYIRAPVPWQWSASTLFLSMVRLRPKRIPFNFASSLPSFVRSSILCRSAWATADRMVTTINVHVSTRQTCFKNRLIRCVGNFGGSGVEPPINICFVLGSIQHRSS